MRVQCERGGRFTVRVSLPQKDIGWALLLHYSTNIFTVTYSKCNILKLNQKYTQRTHKTNVRKLILLKMSLWNYRQLLTVCFISYKNVGNFQYALHFFMTLAAMLANNYRLIVVDFCLPSVSQSRWTVYNIIVWIIVWMFALSSSSKMRKIFKKKQLLSLLVKMKEIITVVNNFLNSCIKYLITSEEISRHALSEKLNFWAMERQRVHRILKQHYHMFFNDIVDPLSVP